MKNVIVIFDKELGKTRAFSNLLKACQEYGISSHSVNNYITRRKVPFESESLRIERIELE